MEKEQEDIRVSADPVSYTHLILLYYNYNSETALNMYREVVEI